MKNIALIIFALTISTFTFAQNEKYTAAMETAISYLEDENSLLVAANTFERIAGAAKDEWLPQYYLAQSNLFLAWGAMQKDDWNGFDAHIEKSNKAIAAAKKVAGKNAELLTMEAYIYQARIMRNPMINGPRFAGEIDALLVEAIEMSPNNPRPYYLQGQQKFNMPSFLGGGAESALPYFELAAEKFTNFAPESNLHPNWGKGNNEHMLNRAKERS